MYITAKEYKIIVNKFNLLCKRNWLNKIKRYIKKDMISIDDIRQCVILAAEYGHIELFNYLSLLLDEKKYTGDRIHLPACVYRAVDNKKNKMVIHLLTILYSNNFSECFFESNNSYVLLTIRECGLSLSKTKMVAIIQKFETHF